MAGRGINKKTSKTYIGEQHNTYPMQEGKHIIRKQRITLQIIA
jgi:hypothetical protein